MMPTKQASSKWARQLFPLHLQVSVPQHRMTPLKAHWMSLYEPVTQNMKLDMRMNLKSKKVGSFLVSRVLPRCIFIPAALDIILSCP